MRRRLRFVGHILRMDPQRLLRRTFIALISRSRRPSGSLLHGLDSMTLDEIISLANNRRDWSRQINSLCIWHLRCWCSNAPYRCCTQCVHCIPYIHIFTYQVSYRFTCFTNLPIMSLWDIQSIIKCGRIWRVQYVYNRFTRCHFKFPVQNCQSCTPLLFPIEEEWSYVG